MYHFTDAITNINDNNKEENFFETDSNTIPALSITGMLAYGCHYHGKDFTESYPFVDFSLEIDNAIIHLWLQDKVSEKMLKIWLIKLLNHVLKLSDLIRGESSCV